MSRSILVACSSDHDPLAGVVFILSVLLAARRDTGRTKSGRETAGPYKEE